MGRKLDALLGRNFKTSKFKTLAKLAISRINILKNQHQVRYSHARSDVTELLNLGHHEQALLRVDHIIKEQNMVDAFTIMESYCNLLIERVMLIHKNMECPDELKEATSSLMFASSRCGEIPELLHIRGVLSSTFGKEFIARAVELRNSCSVHPKMIQKLSTRRPSLKTKLKLLKEIASEKGITLHLDVNEEDESISNKSEKMQDSTNEIGVNEGFTESVKAKKKYRDVADAAQEAFVSAAHAAEAARAAVELSRIGHEDFDLDDPSGSTHAMPETVAPTSSDLELDEVEEIRQKLWLERTVSTSSSDSGSDIAAEEKLSLDQVGDQNDFSGDDQLAISVSDTDMEKAKEVTQDISAEEKLYLDQPRENDGLDNDELAISIFDTDTEKIKAEEKLSSDQPRDNDELAISIFDTDTEIKAEEKLSLDQPRENDGLDDDELAISVFNADTKKARVETQCEKLHDLSSDSTYNEEINEERKLGYECSKLRNTESLNFEEPLHSHMNKKWVSVRTRRDHTI